MRSVMHNTARTITHAPLCALLVAGLAVPLPAGDGWTLERSSGDIRIFTRSAPGLRLKEFRGECVIPAPLEAVRSVMLDHDRYGLWFAMTRRITLLREESPSRFTVNYIVASPWPVADRETDVSIALRFDEKAGTGSVELDAVRSNDPTGRNGLVRITDMRGRFTFTRVDSGRTAAVLVMRVDPRINMSAKIQNDFLLRYPLDTLNALRRMAAHGRPAR